jgi:hypothetical protein
MFWNEQERLWQRHPQCRCTDEHLKVSPCYCRWLDPLDKFGHPIQGTASEGMREKEHGRTV